MCVCVWRAAIRECALSSAERAQRQADARHAADPSDLGTGDTLLILSLSLSPPPP
eukprot:SAG25_NODE_487_length_7465_cov_4.695900_7_plen_54_part_01